MNDTASDDVDEDVEEEQGEVPFIDEGVEPVESQAVEETFTEEKVEPVESLKDIKDSISDAAKSIVQTVTDKVEEKIQSSVEKEERKSVGNEEDIEPVHVQKTVKPLGSDKEVTPEDQPTESSNDNETQPDSASIPQDQEIIGDDEESAQNISETSAQNETVPEEKSEGGITWRQWMQDQGQATETEPGVQAISDENEAGGVNDEETLEEEIEEANDKEASSAVAEQESQDAECAGEGIEEAEAEAPCTEEIIEPVEAIIDEVEIESVSDNIETGSEQSTTSDIMEIKKSQKSSSCSLLLGALLLAFIAVVIALLSLDISKAIRFVEPEPEPVSKPFWKIF